MDLFEVSTAQHERFLAATKRQLPRRWETVDLFVHGDWPVIGVNWEDAETYCRWAGKRLPTEAEWAKAARGTDECLYSRGNQMPTASLANFVLGARFSYSQVPMPVDYYKQGESPEGLSAMAGNAWEWGQDWYGANYYEVSAERNL